jgi:hypothetical protein
MPHKAASSKSKSSGPKYGPKASAKVETAMHKMKAGKLKSGTSGKPVKSRAQAVAIGLSEARKAGAKVPPPKPKTSTSTKSKTPAK